MSSSGLPPSNALFPALYLYPLNNTWAPKRVALTNMHTKIGRQTSSKTAPGERNGFFDSKVLSRQHAEVWEEGGKIYIKDVKSSNGTFINGERLSSEGHKSEPFELKSDDIVELGVDISSLATHHDRVRQLEGALEAQEGLRREVVVLRELVMRGASSSGTSGAGSSDLREVRLEEGSHKEAMGEGHRTCDDDDKGGEGHEDDNEEEEDDDDDARSVSTIIPHKLESVEEEGEEAVARTECGEDGDGEPDHEARDAQHGVEDKDHSVSEIVDSSSLDQEHEHEQSDEHGSEDEAEAEKRKQEDLKVGKPRSSGASGSKDEEDRESGDKKAMPAQKLEGQKGVGLVDDPMRMLATPEPSVVFKLSESAVSSLDGDRDQDKSLLSGKTRTHPLADSSDVDADVLSRSFDEDSVAGKYKQSSGDGLEGAYRIYLAG
uniref:FHA domain-containing protein n=1 Tax=Psilocybe cubensis TaxID=181762 RepID=A0A8H7Y444_PSICU